MFNFAGSYSYNPTGDYGFKIDDININNGALTGVNNLFIALEGSFIGLQVNDILVNNVTCNAMSLVYLSPTQVTNDAKLSNWMVTNSILDNSFKLMKYPSGASAEKIDISTITLNGGTILTQTTLFSIEGTVTNLDMTTILFDTTTKIGESSALDQTG